MLVALAVLAGSFALQEPAAVEYTTQLAGKTIKFNLKPTEPPPYPEDVLAWDGWGFDFKGTRIAPRTFGVVRLPAGLDSDYAAALLKRTDATPVWRTKIYIATASEVVEKDDEGVWRTSRATIEDFQRERILQSIARFEAIATIMSGGAIQMKTDVEFDTEPLRAEVPVNEGIFAPGVREAFISRRINGPGFEAEDRVFRGPYNSSFLLHPAMGAGFGSGLNEEMAYSSLPVYGDIGLPELGSFEMPLLIEWFDQVRNIAYARGREPYVPWSQLAAPGDLSAVAQEGLMLGSPPLAAPNEPTLFTPAPAAAGTTLSLVNDVERGAVLQYQEHGRTPKENAMARGGGTVAPSSEGGALFDPIPTPFLTFLAKSVSKDPLALGFYSGDAKIAEVVLGRVDPSVAPPHVGTDFVADGQWHQVAVDLRTILSVPATVMAFGPPTASLRYDKLSLGAVEYQFDDFKLLAQPPEGYKPYVAPEPSLDSKDDTARVRALAAITTASGKDAIDTAARLIQDPSEWIRLNAVAVFTRVKHPAAEPALIQSVGSLSKRIGQFAVRALAFQDTETSWAAVRRALELAPLDLARREAAVQIGLRKDPNTAGALSALIANRSRTVRQAAAEAIGNLGGEKPQLVLMAFLNQDDPAIRETVINLADLSMPQIRRQILYAAVNDPSDAIRTIAYKRLLTAPDAPTRVEALKGVRDDGLYVRRALLAHLAENPSEEARGAIRIAVVDAAPSVRAAALRAFATLPNGVQSAEIENTFMDPHPLVQIALCDLAIATGHKLPDSAIGKLKASKIPAVASRALKL